MLTEVYLSFSKLWPKGKKKPVTIKTLRSMSLLLNDETQHVPSGTEINIAREVFEQLDGGDYTLVVINEPELEVENPAPALPDPAPLPTGWDKLPPQCPRIPRHETIFNRNRFHLLPLCLH